jgi:hypothetical protein
MPGSWGGCVATACGTGGGGAGAGLSAGRLPQPASALTMTPASMAGRPRRIGSRYTGTGFRTGTVEANRNRSTGSETPVGVTALRHWCGL